MKIASLKLPLQFDPQRLQEDLACVPDQEFLRIESKIDWFFAPLISADGSMSEVVTGKGSVRPAPLLERCQYFQEVIASFPCSFLSVRLMRLDAGSVIPRHIDGVDPSKLVRIHIPIITSENVEFMHGGERLVMAPGECWFLDISYPHRVANRGTGARVHLVLDCVVNDFIRELFGPEMQRGRWRRKVEYRLRILRYRVIRAFRTFPVKLIRRFQLLPSHFSWAKKKLGQGAWPKTPNEIWLLVQVLGLLIGVRLLLPCVKLTTLLRWLTPSRIPPIANPRVLEKAAQYTDGLLWRIPSPPAGRCLPRSLTLYYVSTRCGFPVQVQCGVRRVGETLQGHAWLSLHERPFLESGDPADSYAVTFTFPGHERPRPGQRNKELAALRGTKRSG